MTDAGILVCLYCKQERLNDHETWPAVPRDGGAFCAVNTIHTHESPSLPGALEPVLSLSKDLDSETWKNTNPKPTSVFLRTDSFGPLPKTTAA